MYHKFNIKNVLELNISVKLLVKYILHHKTKFEEIVRNIKTFGDDYDYGILEKHMDIICLLVKKNREYEDDVIKFIESFNERALRNLRDEFKCSDIRDLIDNVVKRIN